LQFKVGEDNFGFNFASAEECNVLTTLVGQIMATFAPTLPTTPHTPHVDDDESMLDFFHT